MYEHWTYQRQYILTCKYLSLTMCKVPDNRLMDKLKKVGMLVFI